MDQRIAKFASFVHGVRRVWSAVTRNSSGCRKGSKEKPHSVRILGDFRMHVGIRSFEKGAGVERWSAMPGAGNVNNICVGLANQPIQMHVNKILPRRSAPMSKQP